MRTSVRDGRETPTTTARRTPGPLIVGLVLAAVIISASVQASLALCDGHLVYALDDAYIHLAIARTLAESGVWGVTPHAWGFASSSPGWTVALAVLYRAGLTAAWVPLALNAVAALALVVLVDAVARRLLVTDRARLWLLAALVLVAPLPALTLAGMEHLWHIVAVIGLAGLTARASVEPLGARHQSALLLAAIAVTALRYEGVFVIASSVLLLGLRRRWRLAITVAASGTLPIVAYGLYASAHGGGWVPTSVVLKAEPPTAGSLAAVLAFLSDKGLPAAYAQPEVAWPLLLCVLLLAALTVRNPALEGEGEAWLLLSTLTTLIHLHLVNFEWFFRYKAYLVVLALVAVAAGVSRVRRTFHVPASALRRPVGRYALLLIAAALCAGPWAVRTVDALSRGPRGTRAIYLQQYQMARFLAAEGQGAVAINDIGAIAYYTRRPIVDLFGLATQRVADARRDRTFDTALIDRVAREANASAAVLYAERFSGAFAVPRTWVAVAEWRSAESATVAHPTVTWFATSPAAAEPLRARLAAFVDELPAGLRTLTPAAPAPTGDAH